MLNFFKKKPAPAPVIEPTLPQDKYKSGNLELKLIYQQKNGNKFYLFENVELMPFPRYEAYCTALAMSKRRIDDKTLTESLSSLNYAFALIRKDPNSTEAIKLHNDTMTDLTVRLALSAERKTITELAKTMILMEGEPQFLTSSEMAFWNAKKEAIWNNDPDMLAFFLELAARKLTHLKDMLAQDLQRYLLSQE